MTIFMAHCNNIHIFKSLLYYLNLKPTKPTNKKTKYKLQTSKTKHIQ